MAGRRRYPPQDALVVPELTPAVIEREVIGYLRRRGLSYVEIGP